MSPHQFSFEKLLVWQEAKELSKEVYKLTKEFPAEEKFGLTQQIRRAAMSVCANIAEGSCRSSAKDQAHFTTIAFGSLIETLNHLIIAFELNLVKEEDYLRIRNGIELLSVKLSNLKKTQLGRIARV